MISKNRIKHIKSLHKKKFRDEYQEFIVEGLKNVSELIDYQPESVHSVFVTKTEILNQKGFENATLISELEMKLISNLTNPSDSLAISRYLNVNVSNEEKLILMLDDIQDPGNFGTIIRTADWFGIKKIICSKNTVDCYNPKVVQASMGSLFRVSIQYLDLIVFLKEKCANKEILGAFMDGENVNTINFTENIVLIMGNEGNGINEELEKFITKKITIPKIGNTESLNVAVATGIILNQII